MGQPVKLSDTLVLDARLCADVTERSIAGQIEFWAGLGKAIEPLLRLDETLRLRQRGKTQSLSDCVEAVETPSGKRRLAAALKKQGFPLYEPDPEDVYGLIRIDAQGRRTRGRFVQRKFVLAG